MPGAAIISDLFAVVEPESLWILNRLVASASFFVEGVIAVFSFLLFVQPKAYLTGAVATFRVSAGQMGWLAVSYGLRMPTQQLVSSRVLEIMRGAE